MVRKLSTRSAVPLAVLLLSPFVATSLEAATFSVESILDNSTVDGSCTLREAIAAHNAAAGANDCGAFDAAVDSIVFAPGVTGNILLDPGLGELVVSAPSLIVQGPGAAQLAVDGGLATSILVADTTAAPSQLTVRGITLRRGLGAPGPGGGNPGGGAIRVAFPAVITLLVEDSVLAENTAPDAPGGFAGRGAAIASLGQLTLRRTRVEGNASSGGAVDHFGLLLVEDSTFLDNGPGFTGAINLFSTLNSTPQDSVVRRTLFSGNSATSNGTAAMRVAIGTLLVENCTFEGNDASAILSSTSSSGAALTIRNSTFANNTDPTTIPNSAVILMQSAATNPSSLVLSSSLFANNQRPDVNIDANSSVTPPVFAFNLFDTTDANLPAVVDCQATTTGGANLCGNAAPGLDPLDDNGGPTQTMALSLSSVAIDIGADPGGLVTDQRGSPFVRVDGAQADIGAYESQPVQACLINTISFSSATYTVNENAGAATVSLARVGECAGSVTFTASNGSASSPADYSSLAITVDLPLFGPAVINVTVPIVDDAILEPNETVLLALSGADASTTLGSPSAATLDIVNDDTTACSPSSVSFASATFAANEEDGPATVTVNRTGTCAIDVDYQTSNGSAIAPSDYTATSGTLSFPEGATPTSLTFQVAVVDDALVEGNESLDLDLLVLVGTPPPPPPILEATLTILDDDQGAVAEIPTLGGWGGALLGLILGGLALHRVSRRHSLGRDNLR